MGVVTHLQQVRAADTLTRALALSHEFASAPVHGNDTEPAIAEALAAVIEALAGTDQVLAIAALHAAVRIDHHTVDELLEEAVRDRRAHIREHAAWACASRPFRESTVDALLEMVMTGGLGGMLAQQCLEEWGRVHARLITRHLITALAQGSSAHSRRLLVETLGLLHTPNAIDLIQHMEADDQEPAPVREAAAAAVANLSEDRAARTKECGAQSGRAGVTVAQLFLGADIDAELRRVGSGNNGGIATLLVRLGDALVDPAVREGGQEPLGQSGAVSRVVTLSRERGDAPRRAHSAHLPATPPGALSTHHTYDTVPLAVTATSADDAWSNYISARRGIARALRRHGPVDAVHLRMADVGTLAAWHVARAAGVAIVFTAAPDPHALIETLEHSGTLTRENFGEHDAADRYWFRTRLVHDLAHSAHHTVLMPREHLREDFARLVSIDIAGTATGNGRARRSDAALSSQFSAIAEGIDVQVIDDAVAEATDAAIGSPASPAIAQLQQLLNALPAARRTLPLLLSVGRLHRVKGMADVVAAWAGSDLRDRCNLLIVGGDLRTPSPDETEQLARIDALVDPAHRADFGLLLAGHRPNAVTARWMAAAQIGLPGFAAPHGVYVCGSVKEEFGLAILEALAAGLFVVAPQRGGPATYLVHGETGFLTDTSNGAKLRAALAEAFTIAASPHAAKRAERARRAVLERFSIRTMAANLSRIYASATAHSHETGQRLQRQPSLKPLLSAHPRPLVHTLGSDGHS